MVKLTFNMLGYTYQSGIDILHRSYTSARQALEDEVERAADDAMTYQHAREGGAEFIGERYEDGSIIWDQQDILNYQHEIAQDALRSFRRAFAISLYHHWERGARAWTKLKKKSAHDSLVKAVEDLGISIDPNLYILRATVNLLKHDNPSWGKKLIDIAPSLIQGNVTTLPSFVDWYEAVVISEQWMSVFFDAIKVSGPTSSTSWS